MSRSRAFFILFAATAGAALADEVAYSGAYGMARTVSSGGAASSLRAATNGSAGASETLLYYGDATTLPAVAEAGDPNAANTPHARASLGIEESNASGLYVSGGLSAETPGGSSTSAADITLKLLLAPVSRASIRLSGIFAAATPTAPAGSFFSLQIFRSTNTGTTSGAPLFSYDGRGAAPADVELFTDSADYLLTLTAHSEPALAKQLNFAFTFDFGAPAVVPEPTAGALLLAGTAGSLAIRRRRTGVTTRAGLF